MVPRRRTIDDREDGPPSQSVVWAVAEAEGVDPTDLPSLHDVVDPDALDALFRGQTRATVTFEYHGYTVTVRENADVVVQEPGPSGP